MKRIVPQLRVSFFILVFIVLMMNCQRAEHEPSVSIVSKSGKAVGVIIRGTELDAEDISTRVQIQLIKQGDRISVLGDFSKHEGDVLFEPLVPFTKGLRYEVLLDDTMFAEIEIPRGDVKPPELLAIYPSQDTLPENLLKMYFEFSEPMVEGSSLTHLTLVQHDGDTLSGTFLDLQPELWNADGTVLTLWLDPGRIKRDLIPNKELGTPLKAGHKYTLHVGSSWRSKNDVELQKSFLKTFVTTKRDETSPQVKSWKILSPTFNNKNPLEIQFPQPLDYYLLKETMTIKNSEEIVSGKISIDDEERIFRFVPDKPWPKRHFKIYIEPRLEDLSGNNLNRPFDRMIDAGSRQQEQKVFVREFDIN